MLWFSAFGTGIAFGWQVAGQTGKLASKAELKPQEHAMHEIAKHYAKTEPIPYCSNCGSDKGCCDCKAHMITPRKPV